MSAQTDGGVRRQMHAGEARSKRYVVKVTPSDETQLEASAAERQITVARLLVESALAPTANDEGSSPLTETDRRALLTALHSLRQLASSTANNVNQIARYSHENRLFPADASEALMVTRELLLRIDEFLDRFNPQSELGIRRRRRGIAVDRVDRQWSDLLGHHEREEEK
ncbi:hypothetical protein [Agromyces sp. NPDC058104]|uniref:hypothetical protein n=1 Tax=Agromyces sp. NPDC058104 TaxID=3346342 RepID=UPI0036DE186C